MTSAFQCEFEPGLRVGIMGPKGGKEETYFDLAGHHVGP